MGRNKKRVYKKPNRVETIEKDLMMTRVAQGASYSAVGKEHGFHHEQVKRMWTALGEDEQKKYLARAKDVNNQVSNALETLSGVFDVRVQNIAKPALIEALTALAGRIHDYSWAEDKLSNKDLAGAIKLLHGITAGVLQPKEPAEEQKETSEVDKIYKFFSESIDTTIITTTTKKSSNE